MSTLTYAYDNANNLSIEIQNIASSGMGGKTVSYTYDADGNRATLGYPDVADGASYSYTGRNQLREVFSGAPPPLATYSYDLAGNRTGKALENGISATYTYDYASRLTALEHTRSGLPMQRFDYVLDTAGLRKSRKETNAVIGAKLDSYTYDPADQIADVKYNHDPLAVPQTFSRETTYNYDPAGNRTTVLEDADGSDPNPAVTAPYTTNDLNQYTSTDGLTAPTNDFDYDTNGNLKRLQNKVGDPVWSYTFDAQNRLTGGNDNQIGGSSFTFTYDARNRCVSRTINGAPPTYYLYDAWSVIEDRTNTGAVQAAYYHGALIDEILATTTATGTYFHHHDGLGNVTTLTDTNGNLVESYRYDIYGQPTIFDPSFTLQPSSSVNNRFLFTGREWLPTVALYDFRNRLHSAILGRWLSRDPIGKDGGVNLYTYVLNDPINRVDPEGLIPLDTIWDIGNVIYDAATGNWDDFAADVVCTMIPYVPAGASKVAKAAKKAEKHPLKNREKRNKERREKPKDPAEKEKRQRENERDKEKTGRGGSDPRPEGDDW